MLGQPGEGGGMARREGLMSMKHSGPGSTAHPKAPPAKVYLFICKAGHETREASERRFLRCHGHICTFRAHRQTEAKP